MGIRDSPQYFVNRLNKLAAEDAIFTFDVGTPVIWTARHLKTNGKRRILGSFSHGSMANAMMHAIGAQNACPNRQVISLSGDGGFTMMMGEMLTLKPVSYTHLYVIQGSMDLLHQDVPLDGPRLHKT